MRTSYFRFGQLRQERGEKHLRNGELVTALNVRQTSKAGVYQKRRAFTMTSMLFSGATWGAATPVSCVTAKDGVGMLMRDSTDRLWSYDGAAASPTWTYKGSQVRAWAKSTTVNPRTYATPMPCSVDVGNNVWTFARKGTFAGGTTATYDLVIASKTSGAVVASVVDVAAGGTSASQGIINMCACYDGTYVWLFYVCMYVGDNNVYCHKFTAASPASPTVTTYATTAAGNTFQHVACAYISAATKVLVAFGGTYNGNSWLYHSVLDPATGAAAVSPGVQTVFSVGSAVPTQGLGFLAGQGSDATVAYYHYHGYQVGGSGVTYCGPVLVKITNIATLAHSVLNGAAEVATVTDVVAATGIRVSIDYGSGLEDRQFVLYSKNGTYLRGAVGNASAFAWLGSSSWAASYAGCWLASSMVQIGSYAYLLTGFDDVAESAVPTGTATITTSTQRTLHLRRFLLTDYPGSFAGQQFEWPWKIVAHVCNGLASAKYHNATLTAISAFRNAALDPLPVVRVPAIFASGNKLYAAAAADAGVVGSVGISLVEFDLAKEWGKDCAFAGRAFGPGSIPICWTKNDNPHEISPLVAPPFVYKSASAGASEYASLAIVYHVRDSDGTLWRSSPYYYGTTYGAGSVFQIPMLRHLLPGTTANIEIYIGTTATPRLQTIVPNFQLNAITGAWDQCIAYTIPAVAAMVDGETLYTIGGGLSQTWPPQCQAIGAWRGRVFLGASNTLWYSQEYTEGTGLLFNEVLRSIWSDCATDINQIKEIDCNYLALIADNGASVIDGPGPDARGSGAYAIKTLKTQAGCSKSAPALSGSSGCYFQDGNTGRLMVANQQLQVVECAGGAYDYSAQSVSAVCYNEDERQLAFFTSTGNAIVIDYQHPTEAAPFGQVYIWTPAAIAYAAGSDSTGIYYLNASGHIHRQAATFRDHDVAGVVTDYREKIKSAPLQMADLQGEFDVSKVQVLGKFNAACSVKITTYPDYAAAGSATTPLAISAAPFQVATRPPSCMRIQAVAIEVEETAGTGAAFDFEGFAIEWLPRGRMKGLNTSQVIS